MLSIKYCGGFSAFNNVVINFFLCIKIVCLCWVNVAIMEEGLVNFLHTATAYEYECVGVALTVFNPLHTEVIHTFQLAMWKLQAISEGES